MTQLLLVASGGIVAVVLVVNERFVTWWVGPPRFGGLPLTAALLAGMFVRQVNFAAVYTLFCFGHERRLAHHGRGRRRGRRRLHAGAGPGAGPDGCRDSA